MFEHLGGRGVVLSKRRDEDRPENGGIRSSAVVGDEMDHARKKVRQNPSGEGRPKEQTARDQRALKSALTEAHECLAEVERS